MYNYRMRIGIFDSGLGGLIIAKSIFKKLPAYDYVYLGDTGHVPYGNRPQAEILNFTQQALRYLFDNDCKLVIIACNTSSAKALRKIQREFLPKYYPDRKVLGVIVPTLESIPKTAKKIGVIATASTCKSHAYKREFAKINSKAQVFEQAAPKLVPLIEGDRLQNAGIPLEQYLKPLRKKNIDALVLGCTHYPILKKEIKRIMGGKVKVISQDEIVPAKLADYLRRHKEISSQLSKNHKRLFAVTKINKGFEQVAKRLFGIKIDLKQVKY